MSKIQIPKFPQLNPEVLGGIKNPEMEEMAASLEFHYKYVTINFDDVDSNTVINNQYASQGATFDVITTNPPSSGGLVYARGEGYYAETFPNVVSLFPYIDHDLVSYFDALDGGIEVKFTKAICNVSIDAMAIWGRNPSDHADNRPFMEAYDTNGTKIAEVLYPYAYDEYGFGTWQRLSYSSSKSNIGSIRFSSQRMGTNHVFGIFDTLMFTYEYRGLFPS